MTGPTTPHGTVLPPQAQLARVVTAVCADLGDRWSAVLADERWADVNAALGRVAVPGAVPRLGRELGDAESERLAALIMSRWSALGDTRLPPAAAIIGPVDDPSGARLTVLVDGLEPGWTTSWHGPVEPVGAGGDTVRLVADPTATAHVMVRVFGRTLEGRTILAAETDVAGSTDQGDGQDAAD